MQFDESQFKIRSRRLLGEPEIPGMIRFMVTKGIVKTEKQAVGVMLACVGLLIVASVVIFRTNSVKPATLDFEYVVTASPN